MKTGILLVNLGTPTAPTVPAVRRFLREFLMDPRVIDLPWLMRSLLVYGFILPFRPRKTTKAYQAIWKENQLSPLLDYSQQLQQALQQQLGETYQIELGMRYAAPNLKQALANFDFQNLEKLIILPLFPQYASATTGSVFAAVNNALKNYPTLPEIHFINDFYQHPAFIQALAETLKPQLQPDSFDCLVLSYHGLPERQIAKLNNSRDCYKTQCYATSSALAQALNLNEAQYRVAFQSRLGRTPWIKPYTDELLIDLYQQGVRKLAIACPSFVTDCLETLEEINIRAREQWLKLGKSVV